MIRLFRQIIINILALYLVSYLFPAVIIKTPLTAIGAGIILSLLMITIRPLLILISLPISLLSFGLFILIINTWMLQLTDLIVGGLVMPGFWMAFITSIVIMLSNYLVKHLNGNAQLSN